MQMVIEGEKVCSPYLEKDKKVTCTLIMGLTEI
jgi:hypothetical protein